MLTFPDTHYDGEGRWRACQFDGRYSAEFLPDGQHNWRMVKRNGKPALFDRQPEAKKAAREAYDAYMRKGDPIRATVPPDPDRMAQKMIAEREDWLQVKRADLKAARTHHRPGKRPYEEIKGKVRA